MMPEIPRKSFMRVNLSFNAIYSFTAPTVTEDINISWRQMKSIIKGMITMVQPVMINSRGNTKISASSLSVGRMTMMGLKNSLVITTRGQR